MRAAEALPRRTRRQCKEGGNRASGSLQAVCVCAREFTKSLVCVCACACVLCAQIPNPQAGGGDRRNAPMGMPPNSTPRVLARATTTTTRVRVPLVGQSALDWRVIKVHPPQPRIPTRPTHPSRTPVCAVNRRDTIRQRRPPHLRLRPNPPRATAIRSARAAPHKHDARTRARASESVRAKARARARARARAENQITTSKQTAFCDRILKTHRTTPSKVALFASG